MTKFVVGQWLCLVLILALGQAQATAAAAVTPAPEVEQSTESPIADMALIEDAPMAPKSPTEKPPMQEAAMEKAAAAAATPASAIPVAAPGQTHTVADFIIHPLIAFKPRQASLDEIQGKQAATPAAGTPASPGTWLFGMNPAQQLGSSFSTLAGSVSGWINDRLGQQLPSFVETPVRTESTTTTAAPGTTTTQKPDIVVRVQQRPQRNGNRRGNGGNGGNGNGNFNGGSGNGNGNGNRRRQRPNRFNNRLDSFEDDYYEDDYFQGNRFDEEFDDDEDDLSLEHFEDDDSSLELRPQQKPKRKQTQSQSQSQSAAQKPKRKQQKPQQPEQEQEPEEEVAQVVTHKRRQSQNKKPKTQKKPVQVQEDSDDEEELEDDENEEDDDQEVQDDESQEQDFLPEPIFGSSSSSRRSQTQPNFIQRGQQSLISQIRQFTRGQTPAEVGSKLRRTSVSGSGSAQTRRPQQATLLVNRNGQTVYVAPELLGLSQAQAYPYAYQGKRQRVPAAGAFPQPPLTVPVRRQGRPTQYITIPWNQLGLSPPERQTMVSLAEGIQAQPLILNIPESAIQPVRGSSSGQQQQKKKKRPQLTASAVPLLADASLMDIFQPPQIPPSRTGGSSTASGHVKPINAQPVLIAAKPVKAGGSGVLPTRIRPGTIVEKAPVMAMDMAMEKPAMEATEAKQEEEQQQQAAGSTETAAQLAAPEQQEFIIVGDDDEPGLSRHVQPAFGDARYVSYGDFHPYFDLLTQNRRFALRKTGRSLESPEVEIKMEEPMKEEMKKEEPLKEEIKMEEPLKEEMTKEEPLKEEIMKEEPLKEEIKMEEPLKEEIKMEEIKKEEIKMEEPLKMEIKMEEAPKKEESPVPALAL